MFRLSMFLLLFIECTTYANAFTEIPIRPDQDGAGPSHIFFLQDDYVAVVDPLEAKLLAIKLCGSQTACDQTLSKTNLSRVFPSGSRFGRVIRQPNQIILVSEDQTKMMIVPKNVADWPSRFAIQDFDRNDPSLAVASLSRNTGDRLTILPRGNLPALSIRAIGPGYLASARELESDRDGRRYVLWKEFRFNDSRPFSPDERTIHVDVYVGRFERDGKLSGVVTIPRKRMGRLGFDYVAVTPDGSVLLLASLDKAGFGITQRRIVAPNEIIVRKYFKLRSRNEKSSLPPEPEKVRDLVSPENPPVDPLSDSADASPSARVAPDPRPSIAQLGRSMDAFRKHPWTVTEANLRDPCEVEIISGHGIDCPEKRFVRPPQFVRKPYPALTGMAYDWGGMDQPKAYNDKLVKGYVAGNIGDTFWSKGRSRVTAGIDCSGLVSSVWRLNDHYPTSDLGTISSPLAQMHQLRVGDILLLEGHHVVLFREQLTPDGASLAIRVTEAASRCGSVCDSVYEIDFFDGFKIRRRKG